MTREDGKGRKWPTSKVGDREDDSPGKACVFGRFMFSHARRGGVVCWFASIAPHASKSLFASPPHVTARALHMPRMAFLQDMARRARPEPLHAWPEVSEEQEEPQDREIGQPGGGHQYQGNHDNAVAGTPDATAAQPAIESSVASPLAALGMYARAVSGSAMSRRERDGGVVAGTMRPGKLSPCLHDARGDRHERQKEPWLWNVIKSLAIATALVAAVVVVVNEGKVCGRGSLNVRR